MMGPAYEEPPFELVVSEENDMSWVPLTSNTNGPFQMLEPKYYTVELRQGGRPLLRIKRALEIEVLDIKAVRQMLDQANSWGLKKDRTSGHTSYEGYEQ